MTEDEYYTALAARPRIRYVVIHSQTGAEIQTFIDPTYAERLAEDDPTVEVIKMVEVTDREISNAEVEAAILERLTNKSTNEYLWPRWPAAYEAAQAVSPLFDAQAAARNSLPDLINRLRSAETQLAAIEALCDEADTQRVTWSGTPLRTGQLTTDQIRSILENS